MDEHKRRTANGIFLFHAVAGSAGTMGCLLFDEHTMLFRIAFAVVFFVLAISAGWINRRNYLRTNND